MGTEALPGDWIMYSRIFIVVAIFCLIAVMVLIVPALFDYLRQWQDNRRMYKDMQISNKPSRPAHIPQRPANTEDAGQSVLGWSPEDAAADSVDLHQPSGREHEAVSGNGKTILVADDDSVVVLALSRGSISVL